MRWENLLAVEAVVKAEDVFLVQEVSAASDTSVRVPSTDAEVCSAVLKVTIVPEPPSPVFFTYAEWIYDVEKSNFPSVPFWVKVRVLSMAGIYTTGVSCLDRGPESAASSYPNA